MVKKNVLTPVLAGVLGLSIVGSGVGYFVVNKDADKTGEKTKNDGVTVSPKLSVMAENISNTLDKAQDIISGEVDYAYEGSVSLKFGEAITKDLDTDIQEFGMSASSQQKAGNESAEIALTYGGKKIVTVDQVYSRENSEVMYVKIPELSDAYIKVNREDAEKYVEEDFGYDLDGYTQAVDDIDFDVDDFEADIKAYEKVIKDNFPAVKEEGTKSGTIDGVAYEYTSKSYDITGPDAQKIAVAVLEKVKTEETLKKAYDDRMQEMYSTLYNGVYDSDDELPIPTFEDSINEMIDSIKEEDFADDNSKLLLETYEDADGEFMGFEFKPDGEDGELRYIVVSNDTAEGIDLFFDAGDGTQMKAYGSMKAEGDAVNGGYTISATDDGAETVKVAYTVKDVKAVGDNFAGTIKVDLSYTEDGETSSMWYEIASKSTADDVDVSFDFGMNNESAFTLTVTGKKTEASDVEIPGDGATIYDALDEEQMNKYLESCDVEGFQEKIKENLGEELYDQLFASRTVENDWQTGDVTWDYDDDWSSDIDWDSDFDWDDDFDWSDFDFDQPA